MMRSMLTSLMLLASLLCPTVADEIAWGDVEADGTLNQRSLDVAVPKSRGAEAFFVDNPMDAYDWAHTATVRNSLFAMLKGKGSKTNSAKIAGLEEALRPIVTALPKEADGRLNNGTARYALHRLFIEKHGWSVKGLQPAGAGWMTSLSVTPDVKDVSKYMVPTYMQDLLSAELGVSGFDLHSIAILAATIEHLVLAEMKSIVYTSMTTHGMPIPGRKSDSEVADLLDTFMMVYAFGLNLDASMLEDVQRAKTHLQKSHSGWAQLQAFARDVKTSVFPEGGLNFDEIVQVVMRIGERYAQWQGNDCGRVKEELSAKPSYRDGHVLLSQVAVVHTSGRRSLFTESPEDLKKLGVLSSDSDFVSTSGTEASMIIPNYINSQSMCLSTASFYTACCLNECESLLAKLERQVAAPGAEPAQLARLLAEVPGLGLAQDLVVELHSLAEVSTGLVALHGRGLAGWMHRAFPLECPAPHKQKVTNPMTPDEWMGESGLEVADLEEMMAEIAQHSSQYATMGKVAGQEIYADNETASDINTDVFILHEEHGPTNVDQVSALMRGDSQWDLVGMLFRLAAMASMAGGAAVVAKSGFLATTTRKGAKLKDDELTDYV